MERPDDKRVCHFVFEHWSYEGQYDAKSDKFINVRQNCDRIQECDFEDIEEWSYVDIKLTKELLKGSRNPRNKELINQMKVWGVWDKS